jgi:hypothetical protein
VFSVISSEESLRFVKAAADAETKTAQHRLTAINRQFLPDNERGNCYEKAY